MKINNRNTFVGLALCLSLNLQLQTAFPQGTAFTYQGWLNNGSAPANGSYDLTFSLYTNNAGGVAIAGPVTKTATVVSNGLFTTTIDFGSAVWNGAANWLEIGVETNGGGGFTTLTPRQELSPAPYAIFAGGANAAGLSGTIPTGGLSGAYANAVNFDNGADSFDGSFYGAFYGSSFIGGDFVGNFIGNGSGLTGVWQTGGNSGTAAGANFIGTRDNQPLEMHVDGIRALRLEPDASGAGAPNVIGGSPVNSVSSGSLGATIGGGGAANDAGLVFSNSVTSSFGTVGGGAQNTASYLATVGGGYQNTAGAGEATVGGGADNMASGIGAFIGGGGYDGNTFAGNTVQANAAAIGGGLDNLIQSGANYALIGSGYQNQVQSNNLYATIAGGYQNEIQSSSGGSSWSAIGGGYGNQIDSDTASTIAGGVINLIQGHAGAIGGGLNNLIQSGASYSAIGGGGGNQIRSNSTYSAVGGGNDNLILIGSQDSTIGGGGGNTISNNNSASAIGGGSGNAIMANVDNAFIGGGYQNTSTGTMSVIGGGQLNSVQNGAQFATIPGGYQNEVSGEYGFAAGYGAQATNLGALVWSDGTGTVTTSTNNNSVTMRASGGYRFFSGTANTTYAFLAAGSGSWTSMSDRNVKEHFQSVNPLDVLDRVAALPVSTWNYKTQPAGIRHIGPTAQDFRAAFAVGETDTGISTVDEGGVALAAIQGLNQKLEQIVKEKDTEIESLQSNNESMKIRLADLETAVKQLTEKTSIAQQVTGQTKETKRSNRQGPPISVRGQAQKIGSARQSFS